MLAGTLLQSLQLYHYYECRRGPFVNLSDLPFVEAEQILTAIRQAGQTFASKRAPDYLAIRRDLEARARLSRDPPRLGSARPPLVRSQGRSPTSCPTALHDGWCVSLAA
jgi:hypothetical protein